jgi:hypothetical protein
VSAWRIGQEAAETTPRAGGHDRDFDRDAGATPAEPDGIKERIDRLTKWIPGDTLALYVPGVTALAAASDAKPSVPWLIFMIIVTPLFVAGSAWAAEGKVGRKTWFTAGLAMLAFVIWTLTVPFSGWQRLDVVSDNQEWVALIAAVFGVLFGMLGEGFRKRGWAA